MESFLHYLLNSDIQHRPHGTPCGRALILSVFLICAVSGVLAQTQENDHPVPILTGNAGYFTTEDDAQYELVPEVNPVLLVPLGDKWLVESRAEFYGDFERPKSGQP